jgi:hypothetical protein
LNQENESLCAFEPARPEHSWDSFSLVMSSLLLVWTVALWIVPDPKPLAAPDWAVDGIHSTFKLSEHGSRAVAATILRGMGLALLGVFVTLSLSSLPIHLAAPASLILAPMLAILSQRLNYGYFPVSLQLQLSIPSAILGVLFGLALRRSWIAGGILVVFLSGGYLWGTSIHMNDDLSNDARLTGEYLLSQAESIPADEAGFARLFELAFAFARDNSHRNDGIYPNQVAILALGVVLGDERVANVAQQPIIIQQEQELQDIRGRVRLAGRNDLARHFVVSAALTVLTDENRALLIGIGKEMMDSTSGGSGFSFVDLLADKAGIRFAVQATRNREGAQALQHRIVDGFENGEFFPNIDGLPEGISGDDFGSQYGGLGGKETKRLIKEIDERIAKCSGFQPGK